MNNIEDAREWQQVIYARSARRDFKQRGKTRDTVQSSINRQAGANKVIDAEQRRRHIAARKLLSLTQTLVNEVYQEQDRVFPVQKTQDTEPSAKSIPEKTN